MFARDSSGVQVGLLDWSQDRPFSAGQLVSIVDILPYNPDSTSQPNFDGGNFIFNGFLSQAYGFCGTIRNLVVMSGYMPDDNVMIYMLVRPTVSNLLVYHCFLNDYFSPI